MQNKDIVCKTCWIQISDSENNSFDCSSRFNGKAKIFKMLFLCCISQYKGAMFLSKSQSIRITLLVLICQFFIIFVLRCCLKSARLYIF